MRIPIAWAIGGSDTGAGAGIQADLKTMNALGVHGCSVVTALTAQNTVGIDKIEPVSPELLKAQLGAVASDLSPSAIKLGMLYSSDLMKVIADELRNLNAFVVCDPVLAATTGSALIKEEALSTLRTLIVPACKVLTPNLPEAHQLLGKKFDYAKLKHLSDETIDAYIEDLAFQLLKFGSESVLIKGGHRPGGFSQDFWTDGWNRVWFTSPTQHGRNSHGTGCTLASGITACVASGYPVLDAIVIAKSYVNQGLNRAPNLGRGCGPIAHLGWPENEDYLPWVTQSGHAGRMRTEFAFERQIGIYPIVDRARWVERLALAGTRVIQLRIKDLTGQALEQEVAHAVHLARMHNSRLYINDYWQLALKYRAHGAHLGQIDILSANLAELKLAGLSLGISTHSYFEVAHALSIRPSYMACGPIFPTITKKMKYAPQGLEQLARWRRTLRCPLVAIGGITLSNAREVRATGVDGIAVVRDIMNAPDPAARVREWFTSLAEQRQLAAVIGSTAAPASYPVPVR